MHILYFVCSVAISAQDGSAQTRSALLPQGYMPTIIGPAKIGKDKADAIWRWRARQAAEELGSRKFQEEEERERHEEEEFRVRMCWRPDEEELELQALAVRASPPQASLPRRYGVDFPENGGGAVNRRWPARSTRTAWRRPGKGIMQQPRYRSLRHFSHT